MRKGLGSSERRAQSPERDVEDVESFSPLSGGGGAAEEQPRGEEPAWGGRAPLPDLAGIAVFYNTDFIMPQV